MEKRRAFEVYKKKKDRLLCHHKSRLSIICCRRAMHLLGKDPSTLFSFRTPLPWKAIRKEEAKKRMSPHHLSRMDTFAQTISFPFKTLLYVFEIGENRADERSLTAQVKILKNACGNSCCRLGLGFIDEFRRALFVSAN
ncbi:hypothetical protein CEXT_464221 [Caerostris extrusa]|uniref:Uncharacterized protein n=1 Tax=Caerostris extrusa TaxID=172846 RepID=A0AAV4TVQ5_CAEEX|nr:hypothetical protein CEXT_464221 [Caerostris extrusa]